MPKDHVQNYALILVVLNLWVLLLESYLDTEKDIQTSCWKLPV